MKTDIKHENRRKEFNQRCERQFAFITSKRNRKENSTREITSEQIQKLYDMLDRAQNNMRKITNGQPLNMLSDEKYGLANYWDGKIVALTEVIYYLTKMEGIYI